MVGENKKSSKFGLGVLIGSVIGAIAAFFLIPTSGKENREIVANKLRDLMKKIDAADIPEKVKEVYGEVTDNAVKTYTHIRKEILKQLRELKEKAEDIDRVKYQKLITAVLKEVKEDALTTTEKLDKIKVTFMKDWHHVFGEEKN